MKKRLALLLLCVSITVPCMAQTPGLPPGLTMSSSGHITGTPTTAGTYQFHVLVCDTETPQQCVTATLGITIYGTLVILGRTIMPVGFKNLSYDVQLKVIGGNGTYVWSLQ